MAASIVDVVASRHIDRSVILDVTQRLAIQTPRYWVAHATVAVAAWLDDNPQQHREALDYALALDYEKTSLFMALLLRDQDRDEALQEWLAAYLSRLTPVNLPRHFQVVIDAATGKALGDGSAPRLVRQMGDWYLEEYDREDIFDATVSEWKRRLLSLGVRYGDAAGLPAARPTRGMGGAVSRYEASRAIEQAAGYFPERFVRAPTCRMTPARARRPAQDLARTEDPERRNSQRQTREPGHHAGQGRP